MNILLFFQQNLSNALKELTEDPERFRDLVRATQDRKFGDYQINAAMSLGKQLHRNPRDVAGEIIQHLDVSGVCIDPEVAGPGFINLRLKPDWIAHQLEEMAGKENLGIVPHSSPRTYVIDYSSPNVAKPMHVGHLRSTVIGDCLASVLSALGHNVVRDNHVGDWGTQFGMILAGYKRFFEETSFENDPVEELARLYRLVNRMATYSASKREFQELDTRLSQSIGSSQNKDENGFHRREQLRQAIEAFESDPVELARVKEHPDLDRVAREETVKLHQGDETNRALWRSFVPPCLTAIDRVYQRLEVTFDHVLGESFYDGMLENVVAELVHRDLAQESQGALCVTVHDRIPPCMVRKSDGAFTYATTDLATIQYRINEFSPDAVLYVVGHPQSLHFEQIFGVAHAWGYRDVEFAHVSFGSVLGDDGRPFRTRAGDTVGLTSLLDEAVQRAADQYELSVVSRRDRGDDVPDLSDIQRNHIAEVVGIGAIKYADLSHNRTGDYVFNWEKMLAMEGNTAAYMQYAYARIQSIFRRGQVDLESLRMTGVRVQLDHETEQTLGLELLRFPEILNAVANEYRPDILTSWLFDLSGKFTRFYSHCPVLKAEDPELKQSRLVLCYITGRILRRGLELLGISVVDQM